MTWDKYAVGFVFGLAFGVAVSGGTKQEIRDSAGVVERETNQMYHRDSVLERISPPDMMRTDPRMNYKKPESS